MSLPSKITVVFCCTAAVGIVVYVHYKQQYERDQLHEGVLRDIERQNLRKEENLYLLQQQIELTKKLEELRNSKNEI